MQPLYVVLIVILIIWCGIFGYMLYIDKEVKNLVEKVRKLEKAEGRKHMAMFLSKRWSSEYKKF